MKKLDYQLMCRQTEGSKILGIIEAKINKNANMNEDIGFSMDPQSYFRTSINGTVFIFISNSSITYIYVLFNINIIKFIKTIE